MHLLELVAFLMILGLGWRLLVWLLAAVKVFLDHLVNPHRYRGKD